MKSSAPSLTYCSKHLLSPGAMVSVPLKTTFKEAVIVEEVDKPQIETAQIVSVLDRHYTKEQLQVAKFISEYYFSSFGEAISLFLPFGQKSVQHTGLSVQDKPTLTSSQQKAYEAILEKDKALLFGVTGSGKTEIFITLIAKILEEGKSSIFLMPEISLTPQMEKRLKVHFGESVAMWHSKLTKKKKDSILKCAQCSKVVLVAARDIHYGDYIDESLFSNDVKNGEPMSCKNCGHDYNIAMLRPDFWHPPLFDKSI